jgi:hypothetical protein
VLRPVGVEREEVIGALGARGFGDFALAADGVDGDEAATVCCPSAGRRRLAYAEANAQRMPAWGSDRGKVLASMAPKSGWARASRRPWT